MSERLLFSALKPMRIDSQGRKPKPIEQHKREVTLGARQNAKTPLLVAAGGSRPASSTSPDMPGPPSEYKGQAAAGLIDVIRVSYLLPTLFQRESTGDNIGMRLVLELIFLARLSYGLRPQV